LKRLSLQLQPYHEVVRIIKDIQEEASTKKKHEARTLGHLVSYALYQFGDRVQDKAYRERENGERIDTWRVEIEILIPLYTGLFLIYLYDESLSIMVRDNLTFPYLEKTLELLRPWSAYLDLNFTGQVSSLNKDQIDYTLGIFSVTERNMGSIYMNRNEFVLAEDHCQQALTYAKLYDGKEELKTDSLCEALSALYELQRDQGNYDEALTLAEEAYNCVAVAYNPVHPKVQEAASTLIECLIFKGDLYDAERYAQFTLDSLKDPANGLDQESEEMATGYYGLGNVIYRQMGDYVKAEMLVRESLRIRTRLQYAQEVSVGMSFGILAKILSAQGKLGSETKDLYERALVIDIEYSGPDGINTAVSNEP
jgi:tetratricopeptide (TPR) repeat protein